MNVFLLFWKKDNTNGATKIKQLNKLFKNFFNYTTFSYRISLRKAQNSLNVQITSFINAFDEFNNFLIVYYGDHNESNTIQNKISFKWTT